ncbi:MAG: hypothetical protein ACI9B8_003859 [Sulfitobacter sp.]|jgi:hypothetical protein
MSSNTRRPLGLDRANIGADSRFKTMAVGGQWVTEKRFFSQAIAVDKPQKEGCL